MNTDRNTSNSSQKPCLGFSELSATLFNSRTLFSMFAAFILVALNGWYIEKEKKNQQENVKNTLNVIMRVKRVAFN